MLIMSGAKYLLLFLIIYIILSIAQLQYEVGAL